MPIREALAYMRPRRPGQNVPITSAPSEQSQVTTQKACPGQAWLCPKKVQKNVQFKGEPTLIRSHQSKKIPPTSKETLLLWLGLISAPKALLWGHINALWGKKINSSQEKPELLHCLLIFQFAYKAIGFPTTSACSSPFSPSPQSLLPPGISLPSSLKLQASLPTQNRRSK